MQYTPGRSLLAAGPAGYVLLPRSDAARSLVESEILPALTGRDDASGSPSALLTELLADGGPLEDVESFAAVLVSGTGERVVLRGGDFVARGVTGEPVGGDGGIDVEVDQEVPAGGVTVALRSDVEPQARLEWLTLQTGAVLAGRARRVPVVPLEAVPAEPEDREVAPPTRLLQAVRSVPGRVPEHTVTHQFLFGSPEADPSDEQVEPALVAPAPDEPERVEPGPAARAASARVSETTERLGGAPGSQQKPGLELTLPPEREPVEPVESAGDSPSREEPAAGKGDAPSALPAMPQGWVSRRTPRRTSTPSLPAAPETPEAPAQRPAVASPVRASFLRPVVARDAQPPAPAAGDVRPVVRPPVRPVPPPVSRPVPPVSRPVPPPVRPVPPPARPVPQEPDQPDPAPQNPVPQNPALQSPALQNPAQQKGFPARRWDEGLTVMARDLPSRPVAPYDEGLLAVTCPQGHQGPPDRPACRVCGRAITDRAVIRVHRPQVGRLCRQGGPDLPVTGTVVFGRQPEWQAAGDQPLLITLEDPEKSISRTHLVVTASGWDVSVTDLGGRNGTVVQAPSGRRQQLVAHQPVVIVPSTLITLADVVSVWFEVP